MLHDKHFMTGCNGKSLNMHRSSCQTSHCVIRPNLLLNFESNRWRLFRVRLLCTKLDTYIYALLLSLHWSLLLFAGYRPPNSQCFGIDIVY